MKKRPLPASRRPSPSSALCAAAILTGAFAFSGEAEAATVFVEDFEGATNAFTMPTYSYSQNYTAANSLTPGGGAKYAHGGAGTGGAASTNTYTASTNPVALLGGDVTAAAIDAGTIGYNLYAQFSSYLSQADSAQVTATFLDGSNTILSSASVGGVAFTAALTPAGNVSKDWLADMNSALVPVGARSVTFTVTEVKTPGGVNIDGYLDNVQFSVNPVPEPAAATLALGALGLIFRRRRA